MKNLLYLQIPLAVFFLASCASSYVSFADGEIPPIGRMDVGTETWNGYSSTVIDAPDSGGAYGEFESAGENARQDEAAGVEVR